jgi:transcriptional regulator with XRE-family HTH domain
MPAKRSAFGPFVREQRLLRSRTHSHLSLRKLAARIAIEPSYLSKIERGQEAPPGEETIRRIARQLDQDPDVLLALAGKISSDLQEIIRQRPKLFAALIRQLKRSPNHALERVVREVRDGNW